MKNKKNYFTYLKRDYRFHKFYSLYDKILSFKDYFLIHKK